MKKISLYFKIMYHKYKLHVLLSCNVSSGVVNIFKVSYFLNDTLSAFLQF